MLPADGPRARPAQAPAGGDGLLADPGLRAGFAGTALVALVIVAPMRVGPFYLGAGLGLDAARTGLVMAAGPAVAAVMGVPAGRLSDRCGAATAAGIGLAIMGAGCAALLLSSAAGVVGYCASLALLTAGYAVFQAANNSALMAAAGAGRRGAAAGLLGLMRNLGFIGGGLVMPWLYAAAGSPGAGLQAVFTAAGCVIALAALLLRAARQRETVELKRRSRAGAASCRD